MTVIVPTGFHAKQRVKRGHGLRERKSINRAWGADEYVMRYRHAACARKRNQKRAKRSNRIRSRF